MKMLLAICGVIVLLANFVEPKVYTNCELGRELMRRWPKYFNRNNIHVWVCIARYESSFNTAAIGPGNPDGSRDYGLFQINNRYWCYPGQGCRVSCGKLLTDNISKVVSCATKIANVQGLSAWTVYRNICHDPARARSTTQGCGF